MNAGCWMLVGIRMKMSFTADKTRELWHSFMVRKSGIKNAKGSDLYSMQVYNSLYFTGFNPAAEFEKWAAVEITDFDTIPEKMESYTLSGGLYAVFVHKGAASASPATFQFIFGKWLPDSDYELDNRPHFELLGDKYRNDDPDSEEEIWIPVKSLKAKNT